MSRLYIFFKRSQIPFLGNEKLLKNQNQKQKNKKIKIKWCDDNFLN